jgi:hypothetical protein
MPEYRNLNFLHKLAGALKSEKYAKYNSEMYSEINGKYFYCSCWIWIQRFSIFGQFSQLKDIQGTRSERMI